MDEQEFLELCRIYPEAAILDRSKLLGFLVSKVCEELGAV